MEEEARRANEETLRGLQIEEARRQRELEEIKRAIESEVQAKLENVRQRRLRMPSTTERLWGAFRLSNGGDEGVEDVTTNGGGALGIFFR